MSETAKNEIDPAKQKRIQEQREATARAILLRKERDGLSKLALHSILSAVIGVLLPFVQILTQRPIWFINLGAIILVGYGAKCSIACFRMRKSESYKGGLKTMANVGIVINAIILLFISVIVTRIVFKI